MAMNYFDGFLLAVPSDNRDRYVAHAEGAVPLFREFGATRMVEGWGEDVPRGKLNDMYGAVQAQDDETVLFSWVEYPDRATRDAAGQRMSTDPRVAALGEMPFDGKRMIWGGFECVGEVGPGGTPGYIDGVAMPLRAEDRDAYIRFAAAMAPIFVDHGALRVIDGLGDDVPTGKVTDFARAVHLEDEEMVAFGWIEWPDRLARDAAWQAIMADPRMAQAGDSPFDGKRMIMGGFIPVVDQ